MDETTADQVSLGPLPGGNFLIRFFAADGSLISDQEVSQECLRKLKLPAEHVKALPVSMPGGCYMHLRLERKDVDPSRN